MSLLNQNGVIELNKSKSGVTLECEVLFKNDNDEEAIEIYDINDCRKYFKNFIVVFAIISTWFVVTMLFKPSNFHMGKYP